MSFTDVQVANIALGKIGADRIASLTDANNLARTVSTFYDFVRDQVLIHGIWNFATGNSTLAKMSVCSNPEFAFEYQLPSDCLKVQKINIVTDGKFKVEADKLFTDLDGVNIKYTKQVTNSGYFSIEFIEAFSHKLAADLCFRLTNNQQRANGLLSEYEQIVLPRARTHDSQESNGDEYDISDFTSVRY